MPVARPVSDLATDFEPGRTLQHGGKVNLTNGTDR
jgi:hypothetical protein